MTENINIPGESSEAVPVVAASNTGSTILLPIEALTILCLHVTSIITISRDIHCTPILQRRLSDESTDKEEHSAIRDEVLVRKFSTKKAPGISLREYLLRLHQYCPMSAAVYLATSWYITRMALVEKIISVTTHNAHRLVLSGLRVATKILEDLHHSHTRFSMVGGVSTRELTRLEICFCYLMDFDLKINGDILSQEITLFQDRCDTAFPGRPIMAATIC
ncbi:predicted protein [Uncinocarpus reesii 1704]|uniref:Cyclin n=1 Tax=Uncinocarpus reesii (strain UAMH 1704) TaxID=336963 RepID=C4JF12_UNCRE|nr:uncharacterized protein UREG_00913 [Uncinocarpus reesii 1704]EEP76065.1 predicted protein [Uncinocarpus reesii 1704]